MVRIVGMLIVLSFSSVFSQCGDRGIAPVVQTSIPSIPTPTQDLGAQRREVVATEIPTPEPTPIPISVSTYPPTYFRPEGRFQTTWESLGGGSSAIGYPLGPQIAQQDFAKQYFTSGVMYWWDNPAGDDLIWVIIVTGDNFQYGDQWYQFTDTWAGDKHHSCDAARQNGRQGPIRGFGKIWCTQSLVSDQIGNPMEAEHGSGGKPPYSVVQFFQGGIMLYNPLDTEIYVLFNAGNWQQFDISHFSEALETKMNVQLINTDQ